MASSAQQRAAKNAQLAAQAAAAAKATEPEHKVVGDATGHNTTGDNRTDAQRAPKPTPAPAPAAPKVTAPKATAPKFPKVKFATRVESLAKWLSEQTKPLTEQEIAAAPAPSPMSPTVAGYTLPSAELANALKALGLKLEGPKDGVYTTVKLEAPKPPAAAPKPRAPRQPARTPAK